MRSLFPLLIALLTPSVLAAQSNRLRVASVFSDHMVVQVNQPIPIWGWADHNCLVTLQWDSIKVTTRAEPDGRWRTQLPAQQFGADAFEAHRITINSSYDEVVLSDILLGEVWLASGQSNMEWPLEQSNSFTEALAKAPLSGLRMFTAGRVSSPLPMDDVQGSWQTFTAENCAAFSAVGSYFGMELLTALERPIGILHSSWGGSRVEAWFSEEALLKHPEGKSQIENARAIEAGSRINSSNYSQPVLSAEEQSDWSPCELPLDFESIAPGFDGSIWFRREVSLPSTWQALDFSLSLGVIDDDEETWINGMALGATQGWQTPRNYSIKGSMRDAFAAGPVTLCVRAIDTGGWGGFSSAKEEIALISSSGERLQLNSGWTWKRGAENQVPAPNHYPTRLYNGMLAPFEGLRFAGCIWYQGESNAENPEAYGRLFPAMIECWRKRLGHGDLPFYFVQLANFIPWEGMDWPGLREAQRSTLEKVEHTGMAVSIDIGNAIDIHPRNKRDVGSRLARLALHGTYGLDVVPSGPLPLTAKHLENACMISFETFGSQLALRAGTKLLGGFELAGSDGIFHVASAAINGEAVHVMSQEVHDPRQVRYAWDNDPQAANLVQSEGLPATPFALPILE